MYNIVFVPPKVVKPVPPLATATVPVTLAAVPDTFPVKSAVIVFAIKFPLASLATIAFIVFALVAVVAEFDTFPAVEIVASFVSGLAAYRSFKHVAPVEIILLLYTIMTNIIHLKEHLF